MPPAGSTQSGISNVTGGSGKLAPLAPQARSAAPSSTATAARAGEGLGISLVDPVRRKDGLLVQGVIVNGGAQAEAIPAMRLTILDKADQVVQRSILRLPPDTLAQGQHKAFKALVQPLPPNAARLTAAFIETTPE